MDVVHRLLLELNNLMNKKHEKKEEIMFMVAISKSPAKDVEMLMKGIISNHPVSYTHLTLPTSDLV